VTLPIEGASDWLFDRIFMSLGGLSLAVGFLWGLTSAREAPAGRAREFLWCLAAGAALGVAWFLTPEYRLTKPGFDAWDIPPQGASPSGWRASWAPHLGELTLHVIMIV